MIAKHEVASDYRHSVSAANHAQERHLPRDTWLAIYLSRARVVKQDEMTDRQARHSAARPERPAQKMARLFIEADLAPGATLGCSVVQANYLLNVLRLRPPAHVAVFNGRDGLWSAQIGSRTRSSCELSLIERLAPQTRPPDLHYLFAPLKKARLDYMAQKATELGASVLRPVMTARTVAERVNLDRLRANAIEAAEQCEILWVPDIRAPVSLEQALREWDNQRALIFCDESARHANPIEALSNVARGPLGVLVGPEGGFTEKEREAVLGCPRAVSVSLGPRIMRADTAAVTALALVNAVLGDWR